MCLKSKPFSVTEKRSIIYRGYGVPHVSHTKISEDVDIPVRKVSDRMLGEYR
jgi:hypothetical protein